MARKDGRIRERDVPDTERECSNPECAADMGALPPSEFTMGQLTATGLCNACYRTRYPQVWIECVLCGKGMQSRRKPDSKHPPRHRDCKRAAKWKRFENGRK